MGGLHMQALLIIFTNDTLANLGVITAGQLMDLNGSRLPDQQMDPDEVCLQNLPLNKLPRDKAKALVNAWRIS